MGSNTAPLSCFGHQGTLRDLQRIFANFLNVKTCSDSKGKGPERPAIVHMGLKKRKKKKKKQASAITEFKIARFLDCGF